ncbi:hypothetical protein BEP19_11570 [Ammoniphilus oxalaticus]|uniref:Uncharacterized protein n=1 Tax=Ammoniphilus oxalaticus TaxID=66863 RepID=A0A419SGG7_9BACL|nr:S4 domain-containing protein YaaA [Ammoniphilus oxalaticus]RKD22870.1 hypothetical protein BEP19_11570 [Ammoniphilus oxalaticus]
MNYETVFIDTEYITLGQFIKLAGVIDTGGQAKDFLSETTVLVNGEKEDRRGKKLYAEDIVQVDAENAFVVARHP